MAYLVHVRRTESLLRHDLQTVLRCHVAALVRRSGLTPLEWLEAYLRVHLRPLVHCLLRHDLAFMFSAAAVLALATTGRIVGLAPLSAYPALHAPVPPGEVALAAALIISALLPFTDRRGIER